MEAFADAPEHLGAYRGPIRGKENGPFLLSGEEKEAFAPYEGHGELSKRACRGGFAGPLWYNSLFWPNFPNLKCLDPRLGDDEAWRHGNSFFLLPRTSMPAFGK